MLLAAAAQPSHVAAASAAAAAADLHLRPVLGAASRTPSSSSLAHARWPTAAAPSSRPSDAACERRSATPPRRRPRSDSPRTAAEMHSPRYLPFPGASAAPPSPPSVAHWRQQQQQQQAQSYALDDAALLHHAAHPHTLTPPLGPHDVRWASLDSLHMQPSASCDGASASASAWTAEQQPSRSSRPASARHSYSRSHPQASELANEPPEPVFKRDDAASGATSQPSQAQVAEWFAQMVW
jgi:hypothetical protein